MSISSAPEAIAAAVSASFTSMLERPLGNAVATDATLTLLPRNASFATATRFGYTHTAATLGTFGQPGRGRSAFEHNERTRPSESLPSNVVRSVHRIASVMPSSFADVLIERFPSAAARASSITASTETDGAR